MIARVISSVSALFVGLLLAGLVPGCATTNKVLKARPAPDSGFLDNTAEMKEHSERAPFHRFWADPSYDTTGYNTLFVARVNTEHVEKQSTWARTNPRNIRIDKDLEMIGEEFRQTVVAKFEEAEDNRFAISRPRSRSRGRSPRFPYSSRRRRRSRSSRRTTC